MLRNAAGQKPSRWPGSGFAWLAVCVFVVSSCRLFNPGDKQATIVWSVAETNASTQQPYADNDLVVFTLLDRRVIGLRARDGSRLWTTQLPAGQPSGVFGALPDKGTIVRWGDAVLVAGWHVYALDRTTGSIRWTFAPDDDFSATSALALAGSAVISAGGINGYLYSVDAASGALRWRVDLDEQLFSPVVVDGVIYVGGRRVVDEHGGLGVGHLWAVDSETGAVRWSVWVGDPSLTFVGGAVGRAAVAGDLVLTAGVTGTVIAVDRATGQTRWQKSFGEEGHSAGVVILDSIAIVASWSGRVRGLDLTSGLVRWEAEVGSTVTWSATSGGGMAFLNPGVLYAYTADGSRVWEYGGRREALYFSTPATYHDGLLYVAANNALAGASGGGLFALRSPD